MIGIDLVTNDRGKGGKVRNKRRLYLVILVGLSLTTLALNLFWFSSPEGVSQKETRSVASSNSPWPISFQQEELRDQGKGVSMGLKPSALDDMIFGFLAGRYAVRMNGDEISSIEFIFQNDGVAPQFVSNSLEFMEKYQGFFSKKAIKVQRWSRIQDGSHFVEDFRAFNSKGQEISSIRMILDANNGLVSLIVDN